MWAKWKIPWRLFLEYRFKVLCLRWCSLLHFWQCLPGTPHTYAYITGLYCDFETRVISRRLAVAQNCQFVSKKPLETASLELISCGPLLLHTNTVHNFVYKLKSSKPINFWRRCCPLDEHFKFKFSLPFFFQTSFHPKISTIWNTIHANYQFLVQKSQKISTT